MDYNEIVKTLQDMESRYADGFSTLDRVFLDKVYYEVFEREITNKGCSSCYRDAYIELTIKLRKDKKMPKKSDYKLKAGAIIQFFGQSQAYTSANLTNEVAEKYLSLNEANVNMFAELPEDWRARVAAYVERSSVKENPEQQPITDIAEATAKLAEKDEIIASHENAIAQRDKAIEDLVAQLEKAGADPNPSDKDLEIENLRMELGTANEQLAAVTEERDNLMAENVKLKKDNKSLRQANTKLKNKTEAAEEADAPEAAEENAE